MNRPETIDETAEWVSSAGGVGIAVKTDHTVPGEVEAIVNRIRLEQGRLDVLVNDVWGGEKLVQWGRPFWELELDNTFKLLERAIHTHIITARLATPLMLETGNALLLEITDGESGYYRGNFAYDLVKNAVIRMAKAMAADASGRQFSPEGFGGGVPRAASLTVVALTPGFLRSEEMLEVMGVTEENWQDAKDRTFATHSESPRYIGRAVAALAADESRARFNGQVLSSWRLMREYGFRDVDGRQPDWGAYFAATHAKDHPEL